MAVVVDYHEEIEVDLLKQGFDLLDFWRGTLQPRRLELLIRYLPADSTFVRASSPDFAELASWSDAEYLIADVFDAITHAHFQNPKPHLRPRDRIRLRRRHEALERQLERNQALRRST